MKTADAVKKNVARALRLFVMIVGLVLVVTALKKATDYRSNEYYNAGAAVEQTSARTIQKQLQCLTRNIYWEAANEPFEGKVAVAQVTINRMESGKFPSSICEVVYQKTTFYNKVVCQFSWFCEANHIQKPVYEKFYRESEEVAKMVMLEGFRLTSLKEAMYYHADYVNPKWNKEKITKIGRHIFYKDKPNV